MKSYIDERRERIIPYKSMETSLYQTRFKIVRLTKIRNELRRIISASGELGSLQIVSESVTRQCEALIEVP